jgi:hypothetical protein
MPAGAHQAGANVAGDELAGHDAAGQLAPFSPITGARSHAEHDADAFAALGNVS